MRAPLRGLAPMRSRMGDRLWEEFLAGAPVARVTAGSIVFSTGSPPRLAAVTAGLVRVFAWGPGGRQLTIRYARPGDLVGLGALLSETEMLTAEAVTDTTLAMVSLDRLRALAAANAELSWAVARQIAVWTAAAVASLVGAGFEQMSVRVAQHLLDLATRAPDGQTVAHVTHRTLADAVGTAREVVTRVLGEFREKGIVCTRPGRVIVLDPLRLAAVAERGPAAEVQAQGVSMATEQEADVAGRPVTVDRLLRHERARPHPPPPAGP